jgi:hypothetical protein
MNDQIVMSKLILTRLGKHIEFRTAVPNMSPSEIRSYIENNYNLTGKILSRSETLSEDGLQLCVTTLHRSNQDRIEYTNDPVIIDMHNVHKAHWVANNIRAGWINEELEGDVVTNRWTGFFNEP